MGLYHILYKNKNKWYFMTIGISLIIYAHMLSTIMFGLAVFVFLLINIKKLYYNRERLKCFIKSVLVIIPLVAFRADAFSKICGNNISFSCVEICQKLRGTSY